ncbi:MAG: DNA-binding protein WhiA [Ruminococcaceae bacterium]|nr:DNA-binding protein WhiA [Oscillospiraceae bacterium]
MSFSTDIKEEICELQPASACCKKAEALGMLVFGRAFSLSEISFMTELNCVAIRYCNLIYELTGVTPVIAYSKAGNHKVRIDTKDERKKVLEFFGYTGKELSLSINFSNFENIDEDENCCYSAFLRGAFLVCGNITNPEKEYHLEFNISRRKLASEFLSVLNEINLNMKTLTRNSTQLIYCKESETIEDCLGKIGATKSFFFLMETKAMKQVKNKINRRTNFEAANLSRTIEAGMAQIELIEYILSKIKLTAMTEDLAELCTLRLENPEASIDELGKMMSTPLSRSAVSRRFKKLKDIKEEIDKR